MNNWATILTFNYNHDAQLAKSRLEADGIEVFLKDELTVQIQNHLSQAMGGVKLQVREKDMVKAIHILKTLGYNIGQKEASPFWIKVDSLTKALPVIGKLAVEIRLLVLVAILLILLCIPVYFMIAPRSF